MHSHPRQNNTFTGLSGGYEALFAAPHRFSFNGQERTDEIAGTGNHNTALYWEYDTRLGRRWNVDPVVKEYESPYLTFSGNPIFNIDQLGNTATNYEDESGKPLLQTKDGKNNTVVVKKDKMMAFVTYTEIAKLKDDIDDPEFNDQLTKYLTDDVSTTDILLAATGVAFSVSEKMSEAILKSRSGITSGKLNTNSPKVYSKDIALKTFWTSKILGFTLSAYSLYDIENKHKKKEINDSRRSYSHANNAIGVFYPKYAVPIATGDYLGQKFEPQITNSITKPEGILFNFTRFVLNLGGIPIQSETNELKK